MGRHPWVFSGAIEKFEGVIQNGEMVAVHGADDRRFIAYGFYNSNSDIRVRLFSWSSETVPNPLFLKGQIEKALQLRKDLQLVKSNEACRLVFSESDGLSGLIVDRYGEYLVLQVTSLALFEQLSCVVDVLQELVAPKGIFLRAVPEQAKKEGFLSEDRVLKGDVPKEPVWIQDGDLELEVQLQTGQKTGLYLDQRENRKAVARLAKGKRVLDLYCNSGAFALHCSKLGAMEVVGVDSSEQAISAAKRNAERNNISNITWVESDVFEYLKARASERYSMMILDPPKFVASQSGMERGMKMYYRLNMEAMKLLSPGGIFVTCSCSGRVSQDEWLSMLSSVAARSKRSLQIIEIRGANTDHPINAHCPESQYLKCVVARVD